MEYRIATADHSFSLQESVNKLIREGWTPHGGIAVRSWVEAESYGPRFHRAELMQAMV